MTQPYATHYLYYTYSRPTASSRWSVFGMAFDEGLARRHCRDLQFQARQRGEKRFQTAILRVERGHGAGQILPPNFGRDPEQPVEGWEVL